MQRAEHNRASIWRTAIVGCALGVLVCAQACSFDARDCTQGVECPSGYECNVGAGICDPISADADSSEPDTQRADAGPPPDTSPPPEDATADPIDVAEPDDTNQPPDPSGECVVDPFSASCSDDDYEPNEDELGAELLTGQVGGCSGWGDDIETFDQSRHDATLCPTDSDWFKYEVNPCDNRSFIVEIYVEPTQNCDPTAYDLILRVGEDQLLASCIDPATETGTNWQCAALANGGKKLSYLVGANDRGSGYTQTVEIRPTVDDDGRAILFDYDLRVRIKQ